MTPGYTGLRKPRRLIVHVPLLLGLSLIISACTSTVTNSDFSVTVPPGWTDQTAQQGSADTALVLEGQVTNAFADNVKVAREPEGSLSLDAVVKLDSDSFDRQLDGLTDAAAVTAVDGAVAEEFTYSWTSWSAGSGESPVQGEQIVAAHNGYFYIITFSATTTTYKADLVNFKSLIAAWKWK